MRTRTRIAIVLGALALAGCASSRPAARPAAAAPEAEAAPPRGAMGRGMMGEGGMREGMGMPMRMGPMGVEGTTVRVEHVPGGAALVFTTTGDVDELRRRVGHAADMMAAGRCPMMPDHDADEPEAREHPDHPGRGI